MYHPALYAFALHLIGNTARAFALAVHASSTAVRKRHRLSIDSSLRAWLFGRIYQKCGRKKGWFEASQTWKEKQPPADELLPNFDDLQSLTSIENILLYLHYGHEFSLGEIASVLALPPEIAGEALWYASLAAYAKLFPMNTVALEHLPHLFNLKNSSGFLEAMQNSSDLQEHLAECPSCQDFYKRLPELEARLAAEYAGTPIPDIKAAKQAVIQKAGLTTPKWLAGLRWKEIALIVSILAGLFYFGRTYDIFTPFDARSTTIPAATATSLPDADAAFTALKERFIITERLNERSLFFDISTISMN